LICDIDRCREAIKEHNLNWIHVCDGKSWGTQLARLYKVNAIPEDFVIDQNGIVVAHDVKKLLEMCPVKETGSKRDMEFVSLGFKILFSPVLALGGLAILIRRRKCKQNQVANIDIQVQREA